MKILSARIDNRLLHGIVATQWAPQIGPNRIMIIDDEVATNPVLKSSMKLGKPAGMAVSIITEEVATDHLLKNAYGEQTIFIIVKSPQIILNLVNKGIAIDKLTLGGTVAPANPTAPGIIKVHNRAYINPAEVPVYQELIRKGIAIEGQYVPSDKVINVQEILANS
ncbi:PTS sugar transporter subunit IIB [Lactobacillus sp. ESL0785]|uniref:PTS sugar transporter subunit IIB n=1 Tax=Lactobacillus sp. ESL0785 TaxID=2983232 RepID=UPI0023F68259|nr:PTS sugar transporter subunit IIB [Lactobacillus sp. ESL0785]WEV70916.1 PTS sugar transporter subunit IIB [Lactobacillus sp. ESL0785]